VALSSAVVAKSDPKKAYSPAPGPYRVAVVLWLPALAAVFYALLHLNWYLGTPLGRVPVLDERENMDLANGIFDGTLPAEPFYRAPGYALLLALVRWAGVSAAGLFPAALLLGTLMHGTNASLVASLARRWFGARAAVIAGLLFALNPVLVHYATQALDSTFSLTLFLGGLVFLASALAQPSRAGAWAGAGILWAAAVLVRPNYLVVWLAAPVLALVQPVAGAVRLRILATSLAGVVLFLAAALWQRSETGSAAFLPWQGPYNLWAANRPGANGRYYSQKISLPPALARMNPARSESLILYQMETNGGPTDIASMNAHWRQDFRDEVTSHPLDWAKLMARKAYALANNWEQYNNKTFAFHKALSPWLRWNPICWGLLFVLAIPGAARLAAESWRTAAALAFIGAACAFSIILFFVSARFRLPLVALCAVLSGGALSSPLFWRGWPGKRQAALAACTGLAVFLAFSALGGVAGTETFVQDHALLARAAFTVGDDTLALSEARAALELQAHHPDALAIEKAAEAELAGNAQAR
jgi:4-amino-4-deoxy-L-arabinose transferase-like glycosyltransferase